MSDSNIFVDGEPLDITRLNEMRTELTKLTATVSATNAALTNSTTKEQFITYAGSINRSLVPTTKGSTVALNYANAKFSASAKPQVIVSPVFSGGSSANNLQFYVDSSSITNTSATLYYSCIGSFTGTVGFDFIAIAAQAI